MNRRCLLASLILITGCSSTIPAGAGRSGPPAASATAVAGGSATAIPAGPSAPSRPSPRVLDSNWLIYQGDGPTIATLTGGDVTPLFHGGRPPEPAHADFSPDGRQITFQAGQEGSWDIWIADADGSGVRDLVDCTSPCTILDDPAWSPIGNEIAFSRLSESGTELPSELDVVDIRTGVVRTVLSVPSGVAIEQPRWSRDARSIVLSMQDHRMPDGILADHPLTSRIGIVDLDQEHPSFRPLTDAQLDASYPDWNPVDDRIVFQAGERLWWDDITTSRSQIWTIQADGSDLRQISAFQPNAPANWLPAWGTSGNRIIATRTDRATRENAVVYVPLDGSMPSTVLVAGAHARQSRARGG